MPEFYTCLRTSGEVTGAESQVNSTVRESTVSSISAVWVTELMPRRRY